MHYYLVLVTSLLDAATLGGCPTTLDSVTAEGYVEVDLKTSLVDESKATDIREKTVTLSCEPLQNNTLMWSLGMKTDSVVRQPEVFPTVSNGTKGMNYATVSGECGCNAEKSCAYRLTLLIPVRTDPKPEPKTGEPDPSVQLRVREENYTLIACSVDRHSQRNVTLMLKSISSQRGCCTDDKAYATITLDDDDGPIGVYQCSREDVDRVLKQQAPHTGNPKARPWDTPSILVVIVLVLVILIAVLQYPIRSAHLKDLLRASDQLHHVQEATERLSKPDLLSHDDDQNNNDTRFVTLGGTIVRLLRGMMCRNNAAQTGNELEIP